MSYTPTAEHRTVLVVDVAGYNSPQRKLIHQFTVHEGLYEVLQGALGECGIEWAACLVENTGDGAMILLPPGFPKGKVADELPGRLLAGLRRYNAVHNALAGVQLRMALNAGEVLPSGPRAVSQAISAACRIIDSAEAKAALRNSGATLAVIASETFYRDVIAHDPATDPESYREIDVDVKETSGKAWLRLIGGKPPGATAESAPSPAAPNGKARTASRIQELTELLLDIPCVLDENSRRILLSLLRPEVATMVAFHPQARMHVMELARTCLRYRGGLAELVMAVELLEPGSEPVRRLAERVAGWGTDPL